MKALLSLALLASLGTAAFAQSLIVSGELTASDPTFRRPTSSNGVVATLVAYDVVPFTVSQSGQYVAEMGGVAPSILDTYLLVYQDAFNPADVLTNLVNGSDDAPPTDFTVLPKTGFINGSRIATGQARNYNANGLSLVAGTTYYAVATAFNGPNTSAGLGAYRLGIGGGPGTVAAVGAVPEPASLAILGVGAAALIRRRRSA